MLFEGSFNYVYIYTYYKLCCWFKPSPTSYDIQVKNASHRIHLLEIVEIMFERQLLGFGDYAFTTELQSYGLGHATSNTRTMISQAKLTTKFDVMWLRKMWQIPSPFINGQNMYWMSLSTLLHLKHTMLSRRFGFLMGTYIKLCGGEIRKRLHLAAQRTGDLSRCHCKKCLDHLMLELPTCSDGKTGAMVCSESCWVAFSLENTYFSQSYCALYSNHIYLWSKLQTMLNMKYWWKILQSFIIMTWIRMERPARFASLPLIPAIWEMKLEYLLCAIWW